MEKRYINILHIGTHYYLLRSRSHISYYGHLNCTIDIGTTYAALKWSFFFIWSKNGVSIAETPHRHPSVYVLLSKYASAGSHYNIYIYTHTHAYNLKRLRVVRGFCCMIIFFSQAPWKTNIGGDAAAAAGHKADPNKLNSVTRP